MNQASIIFVSILIGFLLSNQLSERREKRELASFKQEIENCIPAKEKVKQKISSNKKNRQNESVKTEEKAEANVTNLALAEQQNSPIRSSASNQETRMRLTNGSKPITQEETQFMIDYSKLESNSVAERREFLADGLNSGNVGSEIIAGYITEEIFVYLNTPAKGQAVSSTDYVNYQDLFQLLSRVENNSEAIKVLNWSINKENINPERKEMIIELYQKYWSNPVF